jgi:hypothetical protein
MAYPGKPKYALVSDADSEDIEDHRFLPRPQDRKPSNLPLITQLTTLLLACIILTITLTKPPSTKPPQTTLPVGLNRINPTTPHLLQPCGTTATTARASGCIFDLLTLSWLAPQCYDADLSAEFLEVASEPFYYDMEATRQIPDYETLSERTEESFTTRRYHIFHCSYGWRMMHRALERGRVLESGLSGYHHTEHCTRALMNTSIPLGAVVTTVSIEFPDC